MTINGEDEVLVQKILNGSLEAQKVLYEKYMICLKNFLKKRYVQLFDVDDDISEILTKVFQKIDKYDVKKSKFSSWVFSIANNHMIDRWKSTKHKPCYDNLCLVDGCCSVIDVDYEISDFISYLKHKLTEEDFTILNMKFFEGYNYNEMGKVLNLSSSTISNRVNFLKTKLKKEIKELI